MRSLVFVTLGVAGMLAFGCEAVSTRGSQSGSGGSGAAAGAGGVGGSSDAGPVGCTSIADCANDPAGSYCNVDTGKCVACLPEATTCAQGKYCDPGTNTCVDGCVSNADCSGKTAICDLSTRTCLECNVDTNCPQGSICDNNACVPGCSGQQPCMPGFSCCTPNCYDLAIDANNCGGCNKACPAYPNATAACVDAKCTMGACSAGFADCDSDLTNGCEWNVLQSGSCACAAGTTRSCYEAFAQTQGVGPCKSGTQMCNAGGTGWSPCTGQVLPEAEVCGNNVDEDCNGALDNPVDNDGDGWTICNGDCCDSELQGCANPQLVNPGAFEFVGNGVNDDCNAATSDTVLPAPCSTAAKFTGVTAVDVAKAMEICQTTTPNAQLPQKKWGLITAYQLLANGSNPSATQLAAMKDKQTAILINYGTGGIVPTKGTTMAGLSTGLMRDKNDPGYPGTDTDNGSASTPPAAYLAAHGNKLPSSAGCSGVCPAGEDANDSTNIRLAIRVPTNALSLSYQFKFISSEYWTYSCTRYNDFYLALLQTGAMGIPTDKNISFDLLKNPVSVNNGFFDVCVKKGCYTCPLGISELVGTGMEVSNTGGGTRWLKTEAPVVPGETMQIEFILFDVSDKKLDSVTLLDNFQWGLDAATVSTED